MLLNHLLCWVILRRKEIQPCHDEQSATRSWSHVTEMSYFLLNYFITTVYARKYTCILIVVLEKTQTPNHIQGATRPGLMILLVLKNKIVLHVFQQDIKKISKMSKM